MLTVLIPPTNHKVGWTEIRSEGQHVGRVWGQVDHITLEPAVDQLLVTICFDGITVANLWADQVHHND